MTRRKHSLVSWLESFLSTHEPGKRLPTDAVLASRFGVSAKTVTRLMQQYASDGRVERTAGKGTFIPRTEAIPSEIPSDKTAAEHLAESITGAIHRAEFKTGESLPSMKYMTYRFHASKKTVQEAYRALERDGYVHRVGRSYWIGSFRQLFSNAPGREVWLFASDKGYIQGTLSSDPLQRAYRKLEENLSSHGYALRLKEFADLQQTVESLLGGTSAPQGLVFYRVLYGGEEDMYRQIRTHLSRICRGSQSIPVVVDIDARRPGDLPLGVLALSRPGASLNLSRELARHIAERGLEEVRFFFTVKSLHGVNRNADIWAFCRNYAELKHLNPGIKVGLTVVGTDRDSVTPETGLWLTGNPSAGTRNLSRYTPTEFSSVFPCIRGYRSLQSSLSRPPKRSEWIFAFDDLAMQARIWLSAQRVAVPAQVELISVQDSDIWQADDITHCRSDVDTIGYMMAHAIIGDIPIPREADGSIRVNALLVHRGTT